MQHLPTSTPQMTKGIKKLILIYVDDTEFSIDVPEDSGFHRIENQQSKKGELEIHEVFIATLKG